MRLEEDEAYFKGELGLMQGALDEKVDREEMRRGLEEQAVQFSAELCA
jgi:hypothetical protein